MWDYGHASGPNTLCRESRLQFPRNQLEEVETFATRNICQIAIHLYILETWKRLHDGG